VLVFEKAHVFELVLLLCAQQAVGGGEFGHHQSATAEFAYVLTEDGVSDTCHRGQHRGGRDGHIPKLDGRWHANAVRHLSRGRGIFPVFAHSLILP
jgi:hypothetical protein